MDKEEVNEYISELKTLVKERTETECPSWLHPQIEAAAMNRLLLWKMLEDLTSADSLMVTSEGYNSQDKVSAHPLLAYYDKIQRTLLMQYEAIGINYKTTPSKVKDEVKKSDGKKDSLVNLLDGVKDDVNDLDDESV